VQVLTQPHKAFLKTVNVQKKKESAKVNPRFFLKKEKAATTAHANSFRQWDNVSPIDGVDR
jgi:hypothetical protein